MFLMAGLEVGGSVVVGVVQTPVSVTALKRKRGEEETDRGIQVYLGVEVLALQRAMFCSSTIRATRIEVNGSA